MLGLARSCSFNFMIRPEKFHPARDFARVAPCCPGSVWEESFPINFARPQLLAFLSVANPQPRPPGLVAYLWSNRQGSGHFLSNIWEQPAIPLSDFGEQAAKIAQIALVH